MKIFSVVFQDFSLLSLKAGENVAASVDYDAEKVKECFKLTGITEFDPETYLYNDYKDGIELSGGEAQKIAIARAIYRNSPCMILDEPTAALDPLAESEIYKLQNDNIHIPQAFLVPFRGLHIRVRRGSFDGSWNARRASAKQGVVFCHVELSGAVL